MSHNQPSRATRFNRENSLPSYEEAVANVYQTPTTIYEHSTVHYDEQPDYQYAQPPGSQVAGISSRIPNVHVQSNVFASRANQIEERRRAAARERRNKRWKGSIFIVVIVIIGFLIFYYAYSEYRDTKRTRN